MKIMIISVRQKNVFYPQPVLKMRKFLLDMRKDFLIMINFYLVKILNEPNSLTVVKSKKILKMSNCVLILSIIFSEWESRTWKNLQFLFRFDFFSNDCEFKGPRLEFTRFWGPLGCSGKEFVHIFRPQHSSSLIYLHGNRCCMFFCSSDFHFVWSTAFIVTPSLESLPSMV